MGDEEILDVWLSGQQYQFRRHIVRKWLRTGRKDSSSSSGTVITPMPGKVVKVSQNINIASYYSF